MTDIKPKYVGKYCIGGEYGLHISLEKKPNWWHRFWMRVCFDIRWEDL